MVPDHRLPMERPAIFAHSTADGPLDLGIGPRADAGCLIGRDVAGVDRSEGAPAYLEAARAGIVVAERAGGRSKQVAPTSGHGGLLGRRITLRIDVWNARGRALRDEVRRDEAQL